jgi:uncharacterized membrane protein
MSTKQSKNGLTRWLTHIWLDADNARRQITPAGLLRLEQAVRASEARHLGELRLCVEAGLPPDALWRGEQARNRAIAHFSALRVWDTAGNNGVLIYLLLADRRIEILADRGLSSKVPKAHWQDMADQLSRALQAGQIEAGLLAAIEQVGSLMRTHCPLQSGERNMNELPDAVVLI